MKVISIVGYHKSGKTTLVERLVKELSQLGSVGTVKHTREEILPLAGTRERHLNAGAVGHHRRHRHEEHRDRQGTDVTRRSTGWPARAWISPWWRDSSRAACPRSASGNVEARNVVARVDIDAPAEELVKITMEQPDHVTLNGLVAKIKRSPRYREAGAIGDLYGRFGREIAGNKERTEALEFESFDAVAKERMKAIEDDLKKREGILDVIIYHRTGRIEAGQDIVFIVILSGHRQELFPALRDAIERVKAEVPIWKKEKGP